MPLCALPYKHGLRARDIFRRMTVPDSNQQHKQKLPEEYRAARAALDVANRTLTTLSETAGIPIEHLEAEFLAASRARAKLVEIGRRMAQLDPVHTQP
jgi:hypothetical protein